MARGWESKDVQSRQESIEREKTTRSQTKMDPKARERQARRERLMLDRTRVLGEMQRTCNPRFRGQLERELAFLDAELEKLSA